MYVQIEFLEQIYENTLVVKYIIFGVKDFYTCEIFRV